MEERLVGAFSLKATAHQLACWLFSVPTKNQFLFSTLGGGVHGDFWGNSSVLSCNLWGGVWGAFWNIDWDTLDLGRKYSVEVTSISENGDKLPSSGSTTVISAHGGDTCGDSWGSSSSSIFWSNFQEDDWGTGEGGFHNFVWDVIAFGVEHSVLVSSPSLSSSVTGDKFLIASNVGPVLYGDVFPCASSLSVLLFFIFKFTCFTSSL